MMLRIFYPWVWLILGTWFALWESLAIGTRHTEWTLSDYIWRLENIGAGWSALRYFIAALCLWLFLHLAFGLFRLRRPSASCSSRLGEASAPNGEDHHGGERGDRSEDQADDDSTRDDGGMPAGQHGDHGDRGNRHGTPGERQKRGERSDGSATHGDGADDGEHGRHEGGEDMNQAHAASVSSYLYTRQ